MQLTIGAALISDVLCNAAFISMSADCGGKVSIRPKFAAPQLLLDMRTPFEYLACRQTLDQGDNLSHAVGRNRLNQEVNMVFICTYFQKLQLVALFNFKTNLLNFLIHQIIEYHTTVFRRKYQMIQQYRYIVTLMYVFAHMSILRRKRRGIEP